MIKFVNEMNNEVRLVGVVQDSGFECADGWRIYTVSTVRPQVEKFEPLAWAGTVIDCYKVAIKGSAYKAGDVISFKGMFCNVSNFSDRNVYLCPVCGFAQNSMKMVLPVIKVTKIKLIESGDFCLMSPWNNSVKIFDIEVDDVIFRRKEELANGYITVYSSRRLSCGMLHVGLDESVGYVKKSDKKRHGVIKRATGHMALLQNVDDYFCCENCNYFSKVAQKYPVIIFDEQPEFVEISVN